MIWLIGGTSESRMIARMLSNQSYRWIVTVVSKRAARLYKGLLGDVRVGILTEINLPQFLTINKINCIVDASHPFATEISHQAIATKLPYLRFERPDIPIEKPAIVLSNLEQALQPNYLRRRRILLTLGVKWLALFRPWQDQGIFWARILPTSDAQQQAIKAGFTPKQLILQQLPITIDQERQLWQTLQIDTVITKAGGKAGGLEVKQALAQELGISLIVIARPLMNYPRQTDKLTEVQAFCSQFCQESAR